MDAEREPAEPPDLSTLARELTPPPDLEARTVAALRQHGLLKVASNRRAVLLRIAAAVVLFAGGAAIGRASAVVEPPGADQHGPRYLLLLHGGPSGLSAEEELAVVREYGAWAVQLRGEGRFVTGERLGNAGRSVPPLELTETVDLRGFFLISAASLDDAVGVAQRCPHVRRGGRVVVRPIEPT
jgi:hypothetical protein